MNDYVIVTINGRDYYCPANYINYITDSGVNTSSNNITLYGSLREYGESYTGYPQIILQPYSTAAYRGSYNATISEITINSIEFNKQAQLLRSQTKKDYFSSFLIMLIAVVLLLRRR